MRIAQVSPLAESVPPQAYGGTERVVSWLVETMTLMGHEVTLFAAGDSITSASLRPCCPRSLRSDKSCREPLAYETAMMGRVLAEADQFDIIHFHTSYLQYAVFRGHGTPCLTTLHGRLDLPEVQSLFATFPTMPLVSISDSQRRPMPHANWYATVHHGMPENMLPPGTGEGGYLAFLGRFSPEKGADAAIRIARRTDQPLKLSAKIEHFDRPYFDHLIAPLLSSPGVEYVGEIGEGEKAMFLGSARALLFPVNWPEPFGLVMIEAMATGTPIIAFRCGAVPEIVIDGVTGFVVDDEDDAVEAIGRLQELDRREIRRIFEQRYSARRMVENYIGLYERLIQKGQTARLGDQLENA